MNALNNGNGPAGLATDEARALSEPSVLAGAPVGEDPDELAYRQERAQAKADAEARARKAAMGSGDWSAYEALLAEQDRDDSDVPYAERGRHVSTCQEPWLLHGLSVKRGWLNPDDAAIYGHRLEVSEALYDAGHPSDPDGRLLLPGFTAQDRQDITTWRPFEVGRPLDYGKVAEELAKLTERAGAEDALKQVEKLVDEDMPSFIDRRKQERFNAVLVKIASQHQERHWFYAHPFCSECFPAEVTTVDHYYASWILKHGETRFPAEDWDGMVPPMPVKVDDVDFMTVEDLAELPKPGWLIEDVLPDSGTGILRARDQSFKSFMALDMALQVALDEGRVLYCVGEGANNFGHRIDAWLEHSGHECDEVATLDLFPVVPNLFTGGDLYDRVLIKARREHYDLIVIDTYARATTGSDLNSQGDQSVVTARVDDLRRACGGTVLLVAHSQKSDTDSSGSIEIEDARDFVFAMRRDGNRMEVTFEVVKQKDGVESPEPLRYVAKEVGRSIVLIPAGEVDAEPLMTAKDWIVAALDNSRGLGPRTEAKIQEWVDAERKRLGYGPVVRSTLSSTLSRLVKGGAVSKSGSGYVLNIESPEDAEGES